MKTLFCASTLLVISLAGPAIAAVFQAPLPCLDRLIEEKDVALEDCDNKAGDIVQERGFLVWTRPRQEDRHGFLRARRIGNLSDGAIAYLLVENGGGSGVFSAIIAVRQDGTRLKKTLHIEGGDRCSNGIQGARVQDDRIILQREMTTAQMAGHLMEFVGEQAEQPYDFTHFGREDWPYCATCCVAEREEIYDASSDTVTRKGDLRLNLGNLRRQARSNAAALCLLQAIEAPKGDMFILRGEQETRAFALKVRKHCAQ